MWLNISRFVLPALSLLNIFFSPSDRNSVGIILGRIVSTIFGYILTTWWMEWVSCISSIPIEGHTDQTARVRQISDTLGRWLRAFQVILAIFGILIIAVRQISDTLGRWLRAFQVILAIFGILIIAFLLLKGLTTGMGLPIVVFYIFLEIIFWAGYAVMGWYKAWITDATLWAETRRVTYAFGALSKTLRSWYMVALICNVIIFSYLIFISLSALPMPSEARTTIFLTALGGLVLSTATGWYWREFFGAFTAHATATPAPNTPTSPASL